MQHRQQTGSSWKRLISFGSGRVVHLARYDEQDETELWTDEGHWANEKPVLITVPQVPQWGGFIGRTRVPMPPDASTVPEVRLFIGTLQTNQQAQEVWSKTPEPLPEFVFQSAAQDKLLVNQHTQIRFMEGGKRPQMGTIEFKPDERELFLVVHGLLGLDKSAGGYSISPRSESKELSEFLPELDKLRIQ